MTGYVRPELAHLTVPIGEVARFPGNPRRGDHARIGDSLTKHGQYAPLLVQASTGHVVKGNNTLDVMRALGWTDVAVVRLDIDNERARNLLMIDNRTTDESDYDLPALADLLAGVIDWEATGWRPDDLDDILAELAGDPALSDLDTYSPDLGPPAPSIDLSRPSVPPLAPTRSPPLRPPDASGPRRPPAPPRPVSPPPVRPAVAELLLFLAPDDRAEALRLITATRDWLGPDLTNGDVVLRALRALAAVGDARYDPGRSITFGTILHAAGPGLLEPL